MVIKNREIIGSFPEEYLSTNARKISGWYNENKVSTSYLWTDDLLSLRW